MDALISIVIPVYNVDEFLSRCIESVIKQSYNNLEIILVNDGSTDKSGEICSKYAKKDDRIIVINQENQGLVASRKVGIKRAKGQYIAFVDGDDWIEIDMYRYMINMMIQNEVDVVTCNTMLEYEAIKTESSSKLRRSNIKEGVYRRKGVGEECSYQHIYSDGEGDIPMISPSIWDKLYKINIIKKYYLNIPEQIELGEDFACIAALIPYVESVYISNQVFYHYNRYNWNSITRTVNEQDIISLVKLYGYVKDIYINHENKEFLIEKLNTYFARSSIQYMPGVIKYHFPLEMLKTTEKIIIYGAGAVGKSYIAQFKKDKNIEILAIIDQHKVGNDVDGYKIESIDRVKYMDYDVIVIALLDEEMANSIMANLMRKYKLMKNQIIWAKPKNILYSII